MAARRTYLVGQAVLPFALQSAVDNEIPADERILWMDQPKPGRYALKSIPIFAFAIVWTGFALFWMWGASGFGKDAPGEHPFPYFALFGLPFVLIGIGLLSSPYWAIRIARRTVYLVTERRAVILKGGLFGSIDVRSYGPERLGDISKRQRADGSGDLIFEREVVSYGRAQSTQTRNVGFLAIRQVREAEEAINRLREAAPG